MAVFPNEPLEWIEEFCNDKGIHPPPIFKIYRKETVVKVTLVTLKCIMLQPIHVSNKIKRGF